MIPLSKPWMNDLEAQEVARVISSGWVTQGREVASFEEEFAVYVGAQHAVACSSCTSALHMALYALEIGQDDEVITVSHSFIATVNAVRYLGATPVFIDVEHETGNLDPNLLRQAITAKTKAILVVHQLGMPCDFATISDICREFDLPIIEDAACAVGTELSIENEWQKIGRPHGLVACFSFHPRKLLTCGDGGMLTTNDAELAEKFRLLRQHGMTVSDVSRTDSKNYIRESYIGLGFNYRLTDLQAAVARVQLKRMPEILSRRRQLADRYTRNLTDIERIKAPAIPDYARPNWQTYCSMLAHDIDQDRVINALRARKIASRPGVMCSHMEPAYEDVAIRFPLSVSELRRDRGLMLPLFHQMSEADVDQVCRILNEILPLSRTNA